MTKVKICGITNREDAQLAIDSGADMLGFNFYRHSKRYVEPWIAREIVSPIHDAQKVGVFVNAQQGEICQIVNQVGLDAIQLHGDETAEYILQTRELAPEVPIIKAFRVDADFENTGLTGFGADYILLDGDAGSVFGGAGKRFDWLHARGIDRLILAGGLTPENVGDAIRALRPYAVDVASGVESMPGKKDPEKVRAFIRNAKAA